MTARSIRARLTLWYTGVLVLALCVQGVTVFLLQHRLALAELDTDLAQDQRTVSHGIAAEFGEGMTWPAAVADAMREMLLPEREVAVFCGDRLIGENPAGAGARLAGVRAGAIETRQAAARTWRAAAEPIASPLPDCRLVIARPIDLVVRTEALTFDAIWIGLLVAVAVAGVGGFWMARRALRPLTRLAEECERVPAASVAAPPASAATGDVPGVRLTMPGTGDELDRVVDAFNGLLGRLETVLATQREFMADASHELRTPVSVVRSAAEIALSRPRRDAEDYRDTLDIVAAQSRRMTRLVDDLFFLARVDAGQRPLARARLYLDDVVRESVEALAIVARARHVTIAADLAPHLEIEGDEHLLRQLIVNVLQNAVAWTGAGTRVEVTLRRSDAWADLAIRDHGPGVPESFRPRLFDRFARLPRVDDGIGAVGSETAIAAIAAGTGSAAGVVSAASAPSAASAARAAPATPAASATSAASAASAARAATRDAAAMSIDGDGDGDRIGADAATGADAAGGADASADAYASAAPRATGGTGAISGLPADARARDAGAGLGLAIARAIAHLHGGTITLRASDASGSTFAIALPALPPTLSSSVHLAPATLKRPGM